LHFWAVARYDLKLSADEFFDLTPRQFDALVKRRRSSLEASEFMTAQLISALYNTGFKTPEKPTSPLDFMPSQWAKKRNKPKAAAESGAAVRMGKRKRKDLALNLSNVLMQMVKR